MPSIRDRIRERRLAQWGLAYVAGAFVALQALDALAEPLGLSLFVQQAVLILIVMGLAIALILAWFHGEKGEQPVTVLELALLGGVAVVTVAVLFAARAPVPPVQTATPSPARLPPTVDDGEISIAVLPFEELTPPNDALRMPDAIHDQILTHLHQIPGLNPTSRTSVLAIRDLGLTTRQIADTLGADYVLEGTIQYFDPVVRVIAQVIEPDTDGHVWAEDRDFELSDFLTLQDEVADWVTTAVQAALGGPMAETAHPRAGDPEAYELYLNASYLAHSRKEADLAAAIDAYTRALELDSDFAPALSSLALTYALWGHYGYGGEHASYETFGRALAMVDRAIRLAPDLSEAHATRGYLLSKALAPADTVEASFRRALALAPGSSDAHILYAGFLAREGRFAESIAESNRAVALDPIAPGRDAGMGYNALAAGELEVALSAVDRAAVLEPDLLAPRIVRALALVLLDRADECLDLDLGPYDAIRAICLREAGQAGAADSLIARVRESDGPRNAVLHVASYFAWTGDAEEALNALARAYDNSPHGLDYRVVASGVFGPIREDAAFAEGLAYLRQDVWSRVQTARGATSG
jgi:TolB-like protein/Tfp pilus assembly protein PilF